HSAAAGHRQDRRRQFADRLRRERAVFEVVLEASVILSRADGEGSQVTEWSLRSFAALRMMPALRYRVRVLDVEVDGADLRPQPRGIHDANHEAMTRVAQLRRVHRELPS